MHNDTTTPLVRVDPDDDVITIEHSACTVPLNFEQARHVRDALSELLALHGDRERAEWHEPDRWRWFAPSSEAVTP